MKLCEYGCGREAKYQFKNGKWCCEKHWSKCFKSRENLLKIMNRPEVKEKHRKAVKKVQNQVEVKEKISKAVEETWKNLDIRKKRIEAMNRKELKVKISKAMTLTIKQIQKKYKTFAKEEEMRYNPDKPEEKEIQVHCKYSKCQNSEENGGWFTPNKDQFKNRIYALEKEDGNDGRYFYCLEECKQKCCLYYFKTDPNILTKFDQYFRKVMKQTNISIRKFSKKIKNSELRGKKYGYALDHKYSIYDGFKNDVDPEIISHWKNLECIPELENSRKNKNSSITLKYLKLETNNNI